MKHLFFIIALAICASCSQQKEESSEYDTFDIEAFKASTDSIMQLDQDVRRKITTAIESGGQFDTTLMQEMERIDKSNQEWVTKHLQRHGWPKRSLVGDQASTAVFLVVQHAELPTIEAYYPQLQQLADGGEANAVHAAMMQDRMLMYQGKKQIYGTQASGMLREDGSWVIWPVESPDSINEKRKQVGFLESIEDYAAMMNAVYNPKEALPVDH
ncbi:DUF6624 domain-containing protein [Arthrospiribacter ruber]|uniref:Uncharacterized protein n=1 Tax=Arthrospiribacter ruber TaxID=2487934 RepID=A0A951IYH6_9BACT|nr:DUF6624 domain-containing protein [Arthrospiribacter ruber]MBW3467858.1 hypothetical protein [Arthrospiribacter ruber]